MRILSSYVWTGVLTVLCACTSRSPQNTNDTTAGNGSGGGADDDTSNSGDASLPPSVSDVDAAAEDPLYLIQTRVFLPESTLGFLIPTPSLDGPIDYSRALEQPNGGVLYAEPGVGTFMIGSAESPTITRYEIGPGDALIPGQTISFAEYGVAYMYPGIVFVDAHKAYYLDSDQLQAIHFDPTEMRITGTISLAGVALDGFYATFGDVVRRDDGVYFPGLWYSDDLDRVPSESMLVRIDPETDEITIQRDDRCTGMYISKTTPAGDTYWFSDNYNTFARVGYGADNGVPDCALRLRAGESRFDPEWSLDLTSRVGGAPAVAMAEGPGSNVWLRVLDTDLAALPAMAEADTINIVPAWQWYLLDLQSDAPAVRNDDRAPSPLGGFGLTVDARSFVSTENSEYTESTLIELTADGFVERATVRGVIDEVARVR